MAMEEWQTSRGHKIFLWNYLGHLDTFVEFLWTFFGEFLWTFLLNFCGHFFNSNEKSYTLIKQKPNLTQA